MAIKKGMTTNFFFTPLSLEAVFGSGIRDPGYGMGKIQDPGSGINIPDLQHCCKVRTCLAMQMASMMGLQKRERQR